MTGTMSGEDSLLNVYHILFIGVDSHIIRGLVH